MNDLLKNVEKMSNPAVVVQSIFRLKTSEWKSIYKILEIVVKKISKKIMPINIVFVDLVDHKNVCVGCDSGEHSLILSSKIYTKTKRECYICVHCLEKFKMATDFKNTFFKDDSE